MPRLLSLCLALLVLFVTACTPTAPSQTVTSPGGDVSIEVMLDADRRPHYAVQAHGRSVLDTSALGLTLENGPALHDGFEVVGTTRTSQNKTWIPVWGTDSTITNAYREVVLTLRETEAPSRTLKIAARAYDDGVAFRYRLPEQSALDTLLIASEDT